MKKISVFNFISLDGYFAGPNGEIDFFKDIDKDPEYNEYIHQNSAETNALMFGHTTYNMMKSFWPTPAAAASDQKMADIMNNSPKIVFSKELKGNEEGPVWKNVTIFDDIYQDQIMKMKENGDKDITILGSGSIVQQLTKFGFIDEYCLLVVPVVLGEGKAMFEGVKNLKLKLIESKSFKNGIVILKYQPNK